MSRLNFAQIIGIDILRNVKSGTRLVWLFSFVFLVELYTSYSVISSQNLRNFYEEEVFRELMVNFVLIVQIQTLPIIALILIYDSFVQDPTIKLAAVASRSRMSLFWSKIISITIVTYFLFMLHILVSLGILNYAFGTDNEYIQLFSKSFLPFAAIVLYYVISMSALVLTIYQFTQDKLSANVLPILIFYIIPYLINSSIIFQILNPIILQISPLIWVISFMSMILFGTSSMFGFYAFIISFVVFILILTAMIRNYQFF